jgi:hypothetical protein
MGIITEQAQAEAKLVTFDFQEPPLCVIAGDAVNLAREQNNGHFSEDMVKPRAIRLLLLATIASAFREGMGRADGRIWSVWLEAMNAESFTHARITVAHLRWLIEQLKGEARIPPFMVQWREVVLLYAESMAAG